MDRELVLAVLTCALAGIALWISALWPLRPVAHSASAPAALERQCWRSLWAPLVPVMAVLAAMTGWAALEPSGSVLPPRSVVMASLPFALVFVRATWRAGRALRRRVPVRAAAVVGLFRPRIIVADQFRRSIDAQALAAAVAHETAHIHHRDPLRLWLAQLATDLQWPSQRAAERLRTWIGTVEFARDDDARRQGVEGADLAAAILAAVRLQAGSSALPSLSGDALTLRVASGVCSAANRQTSRSGSPKSALR